MENNKYQKLAEKQNKYYIIPQKGDIIVSHGSGALYKVATEEVSEETVHKALEGEPVTIVVANRIDYVITMYLTDLLDKRAYTWYRKLN